MATEIGNATVTIGIDMSRFNEQMESLLEPITWRHRFIGWLARRFDVKIEVKRRLRGYKQLNRFRGGYI